MQTNPERHIYALLAFSWRSGAATTCVGFLALEKTAEGWSDQVVLVPELMGESDGGWPEQIELARAGRGLVPETVAFWEETTNGVVWEIAEIPASEYESIPTLDEALDVLREDMLSNPDPDPDFLDWLAVRSAGQSAVRDMV